VISSFLKGFFRLLCSRVFWTIIGLIVLCLLIWFLGPLLAFGTLRPLETTEARYLVIGLILAYFLLRLLVKRWRAGHMNERVANMLRSTLSSATSEAPGDKGQTAILSERFNEALNTLRKARFESEQPSVWGRIVRHGRYVYELPWYVIIGAPGVGKTTALLNSGLSFPLSGQIGAAPIRGAGGTRNCDWWFTNEAVLIDTAGRFATHETDVETDKSEWRSFLSLLKKNRTQQPINGVLVMLSVAELLGQKREECQKHAATLRQRLDELRSDLGMSFPVYLLINKCDLMLGFDEYFSALDRSGRGQVWGMTLPLDPSRKYQFDLNKLASECDLLQARISAGLIDVLQAEPDLSRRELIYAFPQQFDALTQALKGMLSDLLEGTRFSESPFLRGIYFTSATQEGTPFDRVMHALGQGFQVQRPQKQAVAGEGKAYFLHELLSKVVFGEAHIAGQDQRAEQRSYAWHIGGYVLSALVLIGATLAWVASRYNNVNYLADVDRNVGEMREVLPALPSMDNADIHQLLPVLEMAASLLDTDLVKVDHPPMWWRFGLFQGSGLKVKVRGEKGLYRQLLSGRFAPAIKANLEERLRNAVSSDDMESSYHVLKAYLMMHDQERLTEKAFVESMEAILGDSFPEEEQKELFIRHVKAAVAMNALSSSKKDENLVAETRKQFKKQTLKERVFKWATKSPGYSKLERFSISDVLEWPLVFKGSGQPHTSLYTKKGYELFKKEREHVLNLVKKDGKWVFDMEVDRSAFSDLEREVDFRYADEYIAVWDWYVTNLDIASTNSMQEMTQIVERLSRNESPLLRFFQRVAQETELVKEPSKDSLAPTIFNRVTAIGGSAARDIASKLVGKNGDPALAVTLYFRDLRKFVSGPEGDGNNAAILERMSDFKKIKDLLDRAIYMQQTRQPMPDTSFLISLSNSPPGAMPEAFRRALIAVADKSGKSIKTAGVIQTTQGMNDEVTGFCKRTIADRYPFNSRATSNVAKDDFADMFGAGGRMDRFRQQQPPGIELPREFEYARTIKDAFFRGGNKPEISFTIKPVVMDGSITNLTLNMGGQQMQYAHGPSVPTTVTWPAAGGEQVRLSLLPQVDNGVNEVIETGLWALHRLFDRHGEIRRGSSPDVFEVVISVGGRRATFEVRPSSTNNPFNLPELKNFRCPQAIPGG